ncbi:SEC23-interacting protein-like isoform X1 [Bufo gargarizans]|uniref:SEC23-interacting protein-like isoform X1 n=1 Tax=Bufo gargarizans TaxID=30331 RepID=UPI001CF224F9|nr:SEC23-interacting protein-like isoform X1 [Bufo gargarizans]
MAENRTSGANRNLLFSPSELSFSVPFIPVSRPGPLSSDESAEVGEEDSFLGQTASTVNPPQTFSYFSQTSSLTTSSDPFASIGQPLVTTASQLPGANAFPKTPVSVPLPPAVQNGQNIVTPPRTSSPFPTNPPSVSSDSAGVFPPNTQICPPPGVNLAPPPPVSSQASYNPYRHNIQSSRANPYLTPPQLQQDTTVGHTSQAFQVASGPPPLYHSSSASLPPPPVASTFMPAQMVQSYSNVRPAAPPVSDSVPFMPNLYEPVQPHWFFCRLVEGREIWLPFSNYDSANLEEVYNSVQPDPESVVVRTAGGRYDVYLYDREMKAVYWEEEDSEVRRCSWFYKGDADSRFVPYSEDFSEKLEAEYRKAVSSNQWHRRLEFPGGETIVMHNPKVIVQFQHSAIPDEWGSPQDGQARPRVVKRGIDDHDDIPDGEVSQADHLVFMVHGIGPVCDLRFRSIVECVDDFRTVSLKLLQSHFKKSVDEGKVRRVEFLPVHWHSALHGDATGVDRHIKKITLPSIGRLRHFTNETLLDILFYNSPTYCQTIVDKVSLEVNRLYELFRSRNPDFTGRVSVAGHSLGSLILFDILSNQADITASPPASTLTKVKKGESAVEKQNNLETRESNEAGLPQEDLPCLQEALASLALAEYTSVLEKEKMDMESLLMCTIDDLKEMGLPLGPRKKIAKYVEELSARQAEKQSLTDKRNRHTKQEEPPPFDVNDGLEPQRRKLPVGAPVSSIHVDYEHFETGTGQVSVRYNSLDFEPVNFFALGSPIGMFLTVRGVNRIEENYRLPTCKGFFNIYHPLDPVAYRLEPMILPDLDLKPLLVPHHKGRKRLHLELKESLSRMGSDLKHGFMSSLRLAWQTLNEFARAHTTSSELQAELEKVADQIQEEEDKQQVEAEKLEGSESYREEDLSVKIGMLNGGRRIDYVLQEKPIESFNEYLFALQSHLCYWESEDTALLILKEIYKSLNVFPDLMLH